MPLTDLELMTLALTGSPFVAVAQVAPPGAAGGLQANDVAEGTGSNMDLNCTAALTWALEKRRHASAVEGPRQDERATCGPVANNESAARGVCGEARHARAYKRVGVYELMVRKRQDAQFVAPDRQDHKVGGAAARGGRNYSHRTAVARLIGGV